MEFDKSVRLHLMHKMKQIWAHYYKPVIDAVEQTKLKEAISFKQWNREKKIKGILVISGCGNSGLDNKESMQIRNKDFIFHKSIGAIRSGLLHKFFQNDRQKIKETSHLVLGSYDIQKNKKKDSWQMRRLAAVGSGYWKTQFAI